MLAVADDELARGLAAEELLTHAGSGQREQAGGARRPGDAHGPGEPGRRPHRRPGRQQRCEQGLAQPLPLGEQLQPAVAVAGVPGVEPGSGAVRIVLDDGTAVVVG